MSPDQSLDGSPKQETEGKSALSAIFDAGRGVDEAKNVDEVITAMADRAQRVTGARPSDAVLDYLRQGSALAALFQQPDMQARFSTPPQAIDDIFDGTQRTLDHAQADLNRWLAREGRTLEQVVNLLRGPLADLVEESERDDPDLDERRCDFVLTAIRPLEGWPPLLPVIQTVGAHALQIPPGWSVAQTAINAGNAADRLLGSDYLPSLVLTHLMLERVLAHLDELTTRRPRLDVLSDLAANVGIGINQALQRTDRNVLTPSAADLVVTSLQMAAITAVNTFEPAVEQRLWSRLRLDLPPGSLSVAAELAAGNRSLEGRYFGHRQVAVLQLFNAVAHALRGNRSRVTSTLFNVGVSLLHGDEEEQSQPELIRLRVVLNAAGAWLSMVSASSELTAVLNEPTLSSLVNMAGAISQLRLRAPMTQGTRDAVIETGRLSRWGPLVTSDNPATNVDVGRLQNIGREYGDDVEFDAGRLLAALHRLMTEVEPRLSGPAADAVPTVGMWKTNDLAIAQWVEELVDRCLWIAVGSERALNGVVSEIRRLSQLAEAETPAFAAARMWEPYAGQPLAELLDDVLPADELARQSEAFTADPEPLSVALRRLSGLG